MQVEKGSEKHISIIMSNSEMFLRFKGSDLFGFDYETVDV